MTFRKFVEQVIGHVEEETFITDDEEVEIIHWYKGIDHFEYHTIDEQSSEYTMIGINLDVLEEMSLELFFCNSVQVSGYID